MRLLSVFVLFGVLTALAGCNSSPSTYNPANLYPTPTLEQLKENANKFKAHAESNAGTSGEQVPLKFVDMTGKEVDLAKYRGQKNVVLVVVKGVPPGFGGAFCPGCLTQLHALTANYDAFKGKGAEVVMVFPGPTDTLSKFLADGKVVGTDGNPTVPFQLLSDADLKAVQALGISGGLARPATYILDKNGNVVFAYVAGADTTYDRPSVQALLDQLDKLNAQK